MLATLALRLAVAATSATVVFAQSGDAARFLPSDPTFVVSMDAPAKLAERFGDTNFADLLASKEMASLWDRAMAMLEPELDAEMPADMKAWLEELARRFEDYRGRATLAFHVDKIDDEDEPRVDAVLVLSADGATDFEAIAELVRERAAKDGVKVVERTIGTGATVEVAVREGDEAGPGELMLPAVVDGQLVAAFTSNAEFLAGLGKRAATDSGDTAAEQPPIELALTPQFWTLVAHAAKKSGEMPPQAAELVLPLITNLGRVGMTVRPAGRFIDMRVEAGASVERPSLLDFFRPERQVDLIEYAPREGSSSTWHVDFDRIWGLVSAAAAQSGRSMSDIEAMVEKAAGFRLRADLVDRFDGDVLVVDATEDMELDLDSEPIPAITIALGLKDSAALEEVVERLLREHGLHAGRKTSEYRGRNVREMTVAALVPLSWAFTADALVLGVGKGCGARVRTLVDAIEDRRGGAEPRPWPEVVKTRLDKLQPGWHMLQVSRNQQSTNMLVSAFEQIPDMPPEVPEMLGEFFELMERFDLATSVGGTMFGRERVVVQGIW